MEVVLLRLVVVVLLSALECGAQSATIPARALDVLLQGYAYRALPRPLPRTGVVYEAAAPANLTGVELSVVRLRSGSLRRRGSKSFMEFDIPVGCVARPYVERLALVYQNIGNWSEVYYRLPGFTLLTPVVGLLVYNASDLNATGPSELDFTATESPISVTFGNLAPVPGGRRPACVSFDLHGLPQFGDLLPGNVCTTSHQGHFAIVLNSTGLAPVPAPAPSKAPPTWMGKKHKSRVWKIVVGVVGGFVGLVLLVLLVLWLRRYRWDRKVVEMERHADMGVALGMARVGDTKAPVALGTRTPPVLENEYVP